MQDNRPVLIVGGSRGTGQLVAQLLLRRGKRVRVLARNAAKASAQLGPSIEVIAGDMTKPETLAPAVQDASNIIVTAGVRSGHYANEQQVRETDYQGVVNVLNAARSVGADTAHTMGTPAIEGMPRSRSVTS